VQQDRPVYKDPPVILASRDSPDRLGQLVVQGRQDSKDREELLGLVEPQVPMALQVHQVLKAVPGFQDQEVCRGRLVQKVRPEPQEQPEHLDRMERTVKLASLVLLEQQD